MGVNIRTKGAGGEREVCRLLVERGLAIEAGRELGQARDSGSDVEVLPHVSIEVKRHENLAINTWWSQVVNSAARVGKIPAVFWRPNHKQWLIMLPAGTIPKAPAPCQVKDRVGRVPNYCRYPHIQFVTFDVFTDWYKETFFRATVISGWQTGPEA